MKIVEAPEASFQTAMILLVGAWTPIPTHLTQELDLTRLILGVEAPTTIDLNRRRLQIHMPILKLTTPPVLIIVMLSKMLVEESIYHHRQTLLTTMMGPLLPL